MNFPNLNMNFPNRNMNFQNPRGMMNANSQKSTTNNASLSNLTSKGQLEHENGQYVLTLNDVPDNKQQVHEATENNTEIQSANVKNQVQANKLNSNSSNENYHNNHNNTKNNDDKTNLDRSNLDRNNLDRNNLDRNNFDRNNLDRNNLDRNNLDRNNFDRNNLDRNNQKNDRVNYDNDRIRNNMEYKAEPECSCNTNNNMTAVYDHREKPKPKKRYSHDLPYPIIKVVEQNEEYALLLLQDYASSHSELTAIMSYTYLNLVISKDYKEIADAYKGISIVEMKHLEILGAFINELGVLPRYYYNNNNKVEMWNGAFVDGSFDFKTTLQKSIENEILGIEQYRKHIEAIDDIYIKKALNRIILDEELHVEILDNLYHKFCI